MKTYEYTIHKTGSTNSRKNVPKGATINRVNGREAIGVCESCDKIILTGQRIGHWADGVVTCYKHSPRGML